MSRRVVILLCSLAVLAPWSAHAGPPDEAARVLDLYRARQVQQADALLDAFLQKYPTADQRCELRLTAALAERPFFDAKLRLKETEEQCRDKPEGPRALLATARLLQLAGNDRPALVACNEFLDRYADNENTPALLLLRGAVELRLPAGSTEADSFARFLAQYPNHPATATARVGLGDTKLRQGDWPAAEEAYLRALAAGPDGVPLPEVYLHLALAAEKQGKKDLARKYCQELVQNWADTAAATQAKDRLETALSVHAGLADAQALWNKERFAASIGVFPSLTDAEQAAKRFTEAGMRVHLLLQGRACELMVGEFDSEAAAALFANELAKRFQVQARPSRLP